MTQVDELRPGSVSQTGIISAIATRTFRVWTRSPNGALAAAGVPQYGAGHPDDTSMTVVARNAIRETAHDACIVSIDYERSFSQGGEATELEVFDTLNELGRVSTDISSKVAVSRYPILRAREIAPAEAVPVDPPPEGRKGWAAFDGAADRVSTTVSIRIAFQAVHTRTLEGLFYFSRPITEQTNRLHLVGGLLYLFSCRRLSQATEGDGVEPNTEVWDAEYSWTYDPGVKVPSILPDGWAVDTTASNVGNSEVRLPALLFPAPGFSDRYIVPPYSDVLHGPLELASDDLDSPEFYAKLNHEIDASGYVGLPGLI